MTTLPSVSQVPWFALSYGLAGTVSMWYGIRRNSLCQRAFVSVGEVAVSIALFNWFVQQERETDRLLGFEATVIILAVVFALALRALSIRLMELTVADRKLAERFSLLPLLYMFLFSLAVSARGFASFERPALSVFMLTVVACALHVCMFAFGKSEAIRRLACTDKLRPIAADRSECVKTWRYAAATIIVPTILALVVQITSGDDWRLMGINLALSGTLVSLVVVACSRRSSVAGSS